MPSQNPLGDGQQGRKRGCLFGGFSKDYRNGEEEGEAEEEEKKIFVYEDAGEKILDFGEC